MEYVGSFAAPRKVAAPLLALVLLLPLAAAGAERARPAPPAGDPIEPGIWRVAGITPGASTADLEPLRQLIGKASVVGFGESSHTSGGYHMAVHRTFRFLVERAGFRAFGIESPWAGADAVAEYVRTCQGSAADALQGLEPIWQSAEIRDLVDWMCQWNRSHPKAKDRLHFFGFDIQQPEVDGPALIAFLGRIGIVEGDPLVEGVERCDGVAAPPVPAGNVAAAAHDACLGTLDAIAEKFSREAKTIIRQTSKTDFEWAKVRLTGLRSWQEYRFYIRSDSVRSDEARDSGMASTLRSMQALRLPKKTKATAWAHNFHISRAPLLDPNGVARTMGTFLSETLGAGYFVVGLVGWEVAVDMGTLCGPSTAPPFSLESRLRDLGEEALLVNTRVPTSVLAAGESVPLSGWDMVPGDHYNALLFLEESPKMTPLFRPPCGP